jgi:hypothetical protein
VSERHWPRPALATIALALLGATAVAGCGGGSASSTGQASATETAGVAATTGHKAITADQLKGALLTNARRQGQAGQVRRCGGDRFQLA